MDLKAFWRVSAVVGMLLLGCSKIQGIPRSPTPGVKPARTAAETASGASASELAGQWLVFYSWGCGSYSETVWNLESDGTFYAPEINRGGTWNVDGRDFKLTFPYEPYATYSGTIDPQGAYMEGTMAGTDGSQGCWQARKKAESGQRTPFPS
jgi:hypothetical protein